MAQSVTRRLAWPSLARVDSGAVAVAGLSLIASVLFLAVAAVRWRNWETSAFDLAFFDQLVWNISRGRIGDSTFIPYNFFGQHIEPVLFVFAPAYWLGAGPQTLVVVQAVVASLAALPLYAAARRFGLAPVAGAALAVAYLANAYLHRALVFDFHPEVMAAMPLFLAAWAVAAERPWLAVGFAGSALILKEDMVFAVLFTAVLLACRGYGREAAWAAAGASAYALVAVLLVMPLARGGADSDLVERYRAIAGGETDGEVLRAILTRPWLVVAHLFEDGRWAAVGLLVLLTAPLALLRPLLVLAALPGVVLAALSSHPEQMKLELHYAVGAVPLLLVAGMVAGAGLRGRDRLAAMAILVPALVGLVALSPLAGALAADGPSAEHRRALDAAIALVPDGAPVSAQSNVLARLSQRREAHEFPAGAGSAEWFVFDDYGHRSGQSIAAGFDAQREAIAAEGRLVFSEDGVEVWRRSPPSERARGAGQAFGEP